MDEKTIIRVGDAFVCTVRRMVYRNGKPVPLSGRAFDVLEALVRAQGDLVTKDALVAAAWPTTVVEENNLQVHICMIRKVLGGKELIQTVHRKGYRLRVEESVPILPSSISHVPISSSRTEDKSAAVQARGDVHYVFIVDDDDRFRASIGRLLASVGICHLAFASAEEFLGADLPNAPACLLLDVSLPDVNGLALQAILNQRGESWPIIFMTGYGTIPMTVEAMKAGATEFLTKPFRPDSLLTIVRASLIAAVCRHQRHETATSLQERYMSLTPREREVMALLTDSKSNKQIASELGITEVTIKVHKKRVLHKMSVKSMIELAQASESLRSMSLKPGRLLEGSNG